MPPATPSPRFAVVGVPGNRRVSLFAEAVRAAGLQEPVVVPWRAVVEASRRDAAAPGAGRTPALDLPADTLLRVDSPGEDEETDRLLRGDALGEGWAPTRVEGGAGWYSGFRQALATLTTAAVATPGCRLLADTGEIAVMFDKRLTHARLAAAGVPVPPILTQPPGGVPGWAELRELMREQRLPRVFVKPAHGSSASGVVALELGPGGRATATTSAQLTATPGGARLHNSLRVRRYREDAELRALFGALAAEPLHIERWLPKAGQRGRAADLRVLVTGGRATHLVVRTSAHPMTNLHLGGARGDLAELRAAVGPQWPALLETAEHAAACFPGSPSVGVDLLPAIGWRRFLVGEVNAFGDLLPGLTGLPGSGAEGLDTYAAFVRHALAPLPSPTNGSTTGSTTGPSTHPGTTHRELLPCH